MDTGERASKQGGCSEEAQLSESASLTHTTPSNGLPDQIQARSEHKLPKVHLEKVMFVFLENLRPLTGPQ